MGKLVHTIHHYFILCGIIMNLVILAFVSYGLYAVYSRGYTAIEIIPKVADRIQYSAPYLADIMRSLSRSTIDYTGFRGKTLDKWAGKGADRNNALFLDIYSRKIRVSSVNELISALSKAEAGDVILIEPGVYRVKQKNINIKNPGLSKKPITVTASRLGDVKLEFDSLEGFYVAAPNWVFQNLQIQGVCQKHSACEHAFHVVGAANSFVLRNSVISDFNAAIKANGISVNGVVNYPDGGLIENNTFYNSAIRETDNPVTILDMVAVSDWTVRDNFIADFIKGKGDKISYAAFFKGNGTSNIFEKNLVVCNYALNQREGARVGLSFGGGGTGNSSCRYGKCPVEHEKGVIRNNVISHCDDVGIYLNKSANTQVYNNTLINTLGIDVRYPQSHASIYNNVLTGRMKEREGGTMNVMNNLVVDIDDLSDVFVNGPALNFSLEVADEIVDRGKDLQKSEKDFCGESRGPGQIDIGAFEYNLGLNVCNPAKIH